MEDADSGGPADPLVISGDENAQDEGAHAAHDTSKGLRSLNDRETVYVTLGFIVFSGLLALALMMLLCSSRPDYPSAPSGGFSITWSQIRYTLQRVSAPPSTFDVPTYLAVLCAIFVPICGYVGFEKPRKLINADQSSLKTLARVAVISALTSAVLAWPYVPLVLPRNSLKDGFDGAGFLALGVVVLAAGMVTILPIIELKEENENAIRETKAEIERLKNSSPEGGQEWNAEASLWGEYRRVAVRSLYSFLTVLPATLFYLIVLILERHHNTRTILETSLWNIFVPGVFVYGMSIRRISTDARIDVDKIKNPNQRFAGLKHAISGSIFWIGIVLWLLLAITVLRGIDWTAVRLIYAALLFVLPLYWLVPYAVHREVKCRLWCMPNNTIKKTRIPMRKIRTIKELRSLKRVEENLRETLFLSEGNISGGH